MDLTNNTSYPALAFEGIDQLKQTFHVVVMRQTFSWNEAGLLIAADNQDPILLHDKLIDPDDVMSGVIEESDLAHYKPKCDIILQGHAYAPKYAYGKTHFQSNLRLQIPNSSIQPAPKATTKYAHIKTSSTAYKQSNTQAHAVQGQTLINKTLSIHSPRYALTKDERSNGIPRYTLYTTKFDKDIKKVSLNPNTSFGGYCFIEETNPKLINLTQLDKSVLIPKDNRELHLNPNHDRIAYIAQDDCNPYGSGFLSSLYHQSVHPRKIDLPQIQSLQQTDMELIDTINQMAKQPLDLEVNKQLSVGFGLRSKSHPERSQFIGRIDDDFIKSDKLLPQGFDFAVWNSAYPDQQTEFLKGNEWLTLTNLCSPSTYASHIDEQGDIKLTLYLPETTPCISVSSLIPETPNAEMPMHLDTLIVSPDTQKVTLVWRAIIIGNYSPKTATLSVLNKTEQEKIIDSYFSRLALLDRPYEDLK